VFLGLFDNEGPPFDGPFTPLGLSPLELRRREGAVSDIDPGNVRGTLQPARRRMGCRLGAGMWQAEGSQSRPKTSGLPDSAIALPPEKWSWVPDHSIYHAPEAVPQDGPATASSSAAEVWVRTERNPRSPSPINYLAYPEGRREALVAVRAPEDHPSSGPPSHRRLVRADVLRARGHRAFETVERRVVEFEALTDNRIRCSARPLRTSTISSSVLLGPHVAGHASRDGRAHISVDPRSGLFKQAVCRHTRSNRASG